MSELVNLKLETQKLYIDFKDTNYKTIIAKQYDNKTRYINICCMDNGVDVQIPKTYVTANLRLKTASGTNIYDKECVTIQNDGTLLVELKDTMLSSPGKAEAEIELRKNDSRLSTMNFYILVQNSPISDNDIIASDEFNALTELYNKYEKITSIGGIDAHVSDKTIHVTSSDKTKWNATEKNVIVGVQKNGTDLPVNATTRKVNVTVPTKVSELENDSNFTTNTGTITGVSVNGTSVATNGVANIKSVPASILTGAIKNGVTATTQTQGDNSTKVATTAYVDTAITNLPTPMVFKGSLGTGGTITSLPAASASNNGYTYKVITDGTYDSQKAQVGDTFISDGSTWVLIPSGDDEGTGGTVTSIKIQATSPIAVDSSNAITTSGTRTISHASSGVTAGNYGDTSNQTPGFGSTFKVPYVSVNDTGHATTVSQHTVKIPNTKATQSSDGLMSADDKKKLDGIASNVSIVNNLTTTVTGSALDAVQGKVLNDKFSDYLPKNGGTINGILKLENPLQMNDGKNYQTPLVVYDDGDDKNFGAELLVSTNGNTFVGGGESASNLRDTYLGENINVDETYTQVGENLFLTADTNIYIYSNCQTIADRKGVALDRDGNMRPTINSQGTLGTSVYPWKTVYTQGSTYSINLDAEKGVVPSSHLFSNLNFTDKNRSRIGCLETAVRSTGYVDTKICAYKNENGSSDFASISVTCAPNGEKYGTAPTPSVANDNTNKIATTEWVTNRLTLIDTATSSANGLMSKEDKSLLDAIDKIQVVTTTDTDLNDYRTFGIYYFSSNYTPKNIPSGSNGWLIVLSHTANTSTTVKQIWMRHGTATTNDYMCYTRLIANTTIGNWFRIAVVENDIVPLQNRLDNIDTFISAAKTLYVSPTGSDSNDGSSSSKALRTIQKAIDMMPYKTAAGNLNCTISIAAGTYTESSNIKISNKNIVLSFTGDIIINGGTTNQPVILCDNCSTVFIQGSSSAIANFRTLTLNGGSYPISVKNGSMGYIRYLKNFNINNFTSASAIDVSYNSSINIDLSSANLNIDFSNVNDTKARVIGVNYNSYAIFKGYGNTTDFTTNLIYPESITTGKQYIYAYAGSFVSSQSVLIPRNVKYGIYSDGSYVALRAMTGCNNAEIPHSANYGGSIRSDQYEEYAGTYKITYPKKSGTVSYTSDLDWVALGLYKGKQSTAIKLPSSFREINVKVNIGKNGSETNDNVFMFSIPYDRLDNTEQAFKDGFYQTSTINASCSVLISKTTINLSNCYYGGKDITADTYLHVSYR